MINSMIVSVLMIKKFKVWNLIRILDMKSKINILAIVIQVIMKI
jgi:hypothetical protein